MSSRPFLKPSIVVDSESMGSDVTSDVTIINYISGLSYDLVWTGTPTGTFSVQVSNSYSENPDGSVKNAGSWTDVSLGSPVTASGSADNAFINLAGIEAYAVRLFYDRTSGTGTLTAIISGKAQ